MYNNLSHWPCQGRGVTLHEPRSRGYWIVGGSKTVIRYCVIWRLWRRPTETQKMTHLPKNVTSHLHLSHFVAWTIWLTGMEGSNSIKNAIRLCLYSCNSHWGGGDLSTGVHGLCCFFAIHKIIFSCFSHSYFPVLPPLSEEHNPSFEQIEEGCGYMNKKTDTVSEGPAEWIET